MNKTQFNKIAKTLPEHPGVYFFKKGTRILYIGKATSLRDRVKSYFTPDLFERRGTRIVKMVEEAGNISFEETHSALEAMIVEAVLIKKHNPQYNAIGSDDKSYQYVVITDEAFPRIALLRANDFMQAEIGAYQLPYKIKKKFGPYPSGRSLKEALTIIRKIFPFRDEKAVQAHTDRFYRSLGLSPNLSDVRAQKEYAKTIKHLTLFFEGKKGALLTSLEKEMRLSARARKFEEADVIKRQLFALKHIRDVSLIKKDFYTDNQRLQTGVRIEAYDVAHTSGRDVVGVMVVLIDGEPDKSQYRKFMIRGGTGNNDVAALREVLERRLEHLEWPLPKLIIVDGSTAQIRAAQSVLAHAGVAIAVVCVTKDEFHRPRSIGGDKTYITGKEDDIIFANAEAHRFALAFHRQKRGKMR